MESGTVGSANASRRSLGRGGTRPSRPIARLQRLEIIFANDDVFYDSLLNLHSNPKLPQLFNEFFAINQVDWPRAVALCFGTGFACKCASCY